jgi:hypothetical protein
MAQINQLGSIPISGGDLTVKNYQGSDIAAKRVVKFDTVNTPDTSKARGVLLTSDSTFALGITLVTLVAGRLGQIRLLGAAVAVASATVHIGDWLMSDSAGKVLPQTAALTAIGRAMSEAANNEDVLVWLCPAKNA